MATSALGTTAGTTDADNNTIEPYVPPFDIRGTIVSAIIISVFFLISFLGNTLTIAVIRASPRLRMIFMYFILSLCASDLISAFISWIWLYRRTWGFEWFAWPDVICRVSLSSNQVTIQSIPADMRIYSRNPRPVVLQQLIHVMQGENEFNWAADLMTNFVTALHIFSFAILRYMSITFPMQFRKISLRHGKIWIGSIWILSFLTGFIPFFVFFTVEERDRHSPDPVARWASCSLTMKWYDQYGVYQRIMFSFLFFAPSIGVILLSVLIGLSVRSRTNTNRRQKEALLQLVLIATAYLIGYVPYTVYDFWALQRLDNSVRYNRLADYWFGTVQYYCIRFSECLNPIFYNLGSRKMRRCTKKYLLTICCIKRERSVSTASVASSSHVTTRDFGV